MAEFDAATIGSGSSAPSEAVATTAEQLLDALDNASIEKALAISVAFRLGAPYSGIENERDRVRAENEYVARQAATAPHRLVAVCSVNPLKDYASDEIRRCAADPRVGGAKFHFSNSGVDLRDAEHVQRLITVFALLGELGLPAVVHLRTEAVDYGAKDAQVFVREILAAAPGLHVQVAHAAGWGGYDEATDSALGVIAEAIENAEIDRDRISIDLAAVVFDPDAAGEDVALADQVRDANSKLAARIREIGAERFLFATDWPSWPPIEQLDIKIARNIGLLHKALPLTNEEWEIIHTNVSPLLAGAQSAP